MEQISERYLNGHPVSCRFQFGNAVIAITFHRRNHSIEIEKLRNFDDHTAEYVLLLIYC